MRIRLGIFLDITRSPKDEPEQFEHRDNDTMVESTGPQRVGFTVPTGDPDPFPDERRRR